MKNSKKLMSCAVILTVLGLAFATAALALLDFNFEKLSAGSPITQTYEIRDKFHSLDIDGLSCNVTLAPSEDKTCRVVYSGEDVIFCTAEVENGSLKVKCTDDRKWYERLGISFRSSTVTIFLPGSSYDNLVITNASGDVAVQDDFLFRKAGVRAVSGSVAFFASVENELSLETVSGDLLLSGSSAGNISLKTVSGNLKCESAKAASFLSAKTTSGSISLSSSEFSSGELESISGSITLSLTRAKDELLARSTSGSIRLIGCDAGVLSLESVSGSVSGSLLSDKVFITESTSGKISVPASVSGGVCRVKTTSGSIDLSIG